MESTRYYELKDQAHSKWMKAQEIISIAEVQYAHGRIDEIEWYRMLADARAIQEDAMEIEKQKLLDAQVELWRKQYSESELQARDWAEQHISERP
jgi:hypothetical protein